MKVLTATISTFVVFTSGVLAQSSCTVSEPMCFSGELCGSPKVCSMFGCSEDGTMCLGVMDDQVACDDSTGTPPDNLCGDTYCADNCFCGAKSSTCMEDSCSNIQSENCPNSLSAGACEPGSLSCKIGGFECEIGSSSRTIICNESTSSSSSSSTSSSSSSSSSSGSSRSRIMRGFRVSVAVSSVAATLVTLVAAKVFS